ncbi:MAG: redoxin domain-containing protein, partial [Planctomycetota bacterium]
MALWGLALANPHQPARAAWYARAAWLGRGLAGPMERALMDGLAGAWGVAGPDERPNLVEPRSPDPGEEDAPAEGTWPEFGPDGAQRWAASLLESSTRFPDVRALHALRADHALRSQETKWLSLDLATRRSLLESIGPVEAQHATHRHAVALWHPGFEGELERAGSKPRAETWPTADRPWGWLGRGIENRARPAGARSVPEQIVRAVQRDLEYAKRNWLHPTDVPGFQERVEVLELALMVSESSGHLARHLVDTDDLPRRPPWLNPITGRVSIEEGEPWTLMPNEEVAACTEPLWTWTPPTAPDFTLPDAYGGEHSLKDHRGHPVLVVHFLGLGCVHCLEQLQALLPFADDFAEADIRILAIGLQEPESVAESLGPKDAEGGYPFPLLCDPKLDTFK